MGENDKNSVDFALEVDMQKNNITAKSCGILNILSFSVCDLNFEIHLTSSYPHTPPRVICTSVNNFPVCSDGRDLLRYIIRWNEGTKIEEIIKSIPDFLTKFKLTDDIGEFQLLSVIPFEVWDEKTSMLWFFCTEIDALNNNTRYPRVIVVTHSYFILLEPCRTYEAGIVLFWASLHTIASVHKSRYDNFEFVINWSSAMGNTVQVFHSKQCRKFCQVLSSNLGRLGSVVQQSFLVEVEDFKDKFKIFDILRQIERHERLLETLVNDEGINSLIALYQKAVEYFSAEEDLRYEIYLSKLQNLFSDRRVFTQVVSEIQPRISKRSRVKSMDFSLPNNTSNEAHKNPTSVLED